MRTEKQQWRNARTPPALAMGQRKKALKRKKFLKPQIMEAHNFYRDEYASWTGWKPGQRRKATTNLRFFEYLVKYYNGWSIDEVAFAMKTTYSTVQGGLKQTEARVTRYFKMKEFNDNKEI